MNICGIDVLTERECPSSSMRSFKALGHAIHSLHSTNLTVGARVRFSNGPIEFCGRITRKIVLERTNGSFTPMIIIEKLGGGTQHTSPFNVVKL